jgi:putative nucleotidyltransferase with HDIG domain
MLYMPQNTDSIYIPHALITAGQAVIIIRRMLLDIGEHIYDGQRMAYIENGERTAYIARRIAEQGMLQDRMPLQDVFLLSLFSGIGSYRFILPNFTSSITDTAVRDYTYSYYFLKNLSPLGENLRFLQFYGSPYNPLLAKTVIQAEYAHLVFFASRVESYLRAHGGRYEADDIYALETAGSGPDYAKLFLAADRRWNISAHLKDSSFLDTIDDWSMHVAYGPEDTLMLIKMLIFIMDFKSTATVMHTINTACFAAALGGRMGCTKTETDELFTAGILHDVGKMAISSSILESPTKLNETDMEIMRSHVDEGVSMFHGIVPEKIELLAARHHEKLDGSGYPYHLTAEDLTKPQRILTVADITSALTDIRSYKNAFPKEKTVEIINEMTNRGELDKEITSCIIGSYDQIQDELKTMRIPLWANFGRISAEFQAAEMTEDL